MSEKNVFEGEAPKDLSELDMIKSFPPTVIWKSDEMLDDEKITSKIIKTSPNENEWKFYIDCRSDGKVDQLVFTVQEKEVGNEKTWVSSIDKASSLFSDVKNDINGLLDDFKVSTFGSAAEFKEKYSAEYEKSLLQTKSNKKTNANDEINPDHSVKTTPVRFRI